MTDTKIQHTPTPYTLDADSRYVLDEYNVLVADTYADTALDLGLPESPEQAKANAEFIVRACNHHDELVEVLEFLVNPDNVATVHAKWGEGCNREEVDTMLARARTILKKARGE